MEISEQATLLRQALGATTLAHKHVLNLLLNLDVESVHVITKNNPVFYDGLCKQDGETEEAHKADRYNTMIKALSNIQEELLEAKRTLINLGIEHVRLKT